MKLRGMQIGLVLIAIVSIIYWAWGYNPLPSDESMIADFYEHRSDFEELVRRYRNFEPEDKQPHSVWVEQSNTKDLLHRAGVDDISYGIGLWYPNPYSMESDKLEIQNVAGFAKYYKFGPLRIMPAPRDSYSAVKLRIGNIWKDYYNFPEVPRIEGGMVLGPINSEGEYAFKVRVLQTLNRLPNIWHDFECVYRQIEPQWFLRMCNGH